MIQETSLDSGAADSYRLLNELVDPDSSYNEAEHLPLFLKKIDLEKHVTC